MKEFNVEKITEDIVEFIRSYYKEHNLGGAVLGISGGKDSAVVAALLTKALGKENVMGLTLPCHSEPNDQKDALLVKDYFGFELINFDLTELFDSFKNNIEELFPRITSRDTKNSDINLKPRLRMSTLYYFAALLTELKGKPYLTVGTSNKSELFVGYFTKGGDSVHDIAVISDLTVEEVIKVGEYLKVPKEVLYKTPSDGLSNLSDEDKLGVRYSDISEYMEGSTKLDEKARTKIAQMHDNSRHKFTIPTFRK